MKFSIGFKMFRPLMSIVKYSGSSLLFIILCGLLIFIWWKGEFLDISGFKPLDNSVSRWLLTAFLLIIAFIFIGWKMVKRLYVLENRQAEDKKYQNNPIKEEIDAQRRYLKHWTLAFKRYLNNKDFEYALPWYILIGGENSGKKSILRNGGGFSELYPNDLTLGSKVNFSIFSNENAVIITPSNNMINQYDNIDEKPGLYSKLWKNLLLWTKEQRERQPFNGVLITIDLDRLLTSSKLENEKHIHLLNQRLQEIYDISQGELPIYILMTKLDSLYGFESIYANLSKIERESILGVTFKNNGEEWSSELSDFWSKLIYNLNDKLPSLLFQANEHKREEIFSYTRQISGALEIIDSFLTQLSYNSGKKFHFIKGIYFTSVAQRGKINNIFISSISEKYKLGNQSHPVWGSVNVVPYFCHKLFNDILFSFPNLAKESRSWQFKYSKKMKVVYSLGCLLTVSILGGWHYFYYINNEAGIKVLEQVKEFKNIKLSNEIDDFGDKQLPLLNPIREATLAYGNYHDISYLLKDMGLYQGNNIGPYVDQTYLKLLQVRFLPAIMNGLKKELNNAPAESEEKLEILRIMRMLDDKSGRDDSFVKEFMKRYWSNEFSGQKTLQDNLMSHLDYTLKHTDWFSERVKGDEQLINAYRPYDQPVKLAQKELSKLSIYSRVYQNLKVKANTVLPTPLDYRDEIGAGFNSVYTTNNEKLVKIPRLFTEHGLKNYFLKQNDYLIDLIAMDSWALNLKENREYSEADRQKINERIIDQYITDYVSVWQSALNSLDIYPFDSISDAINAIEKINGSEQTLKRALAVLAENTQEPNLPNDQKGKELDALLDNLDYKLMSQISNEFSEEKSILRESDDKNSVLQDIYKKLSNLHRYLLSIQNAPNSGKAALQAVKLRMEQNGTDPFFELQQIAKVLPEPISRWLEQLVDYSWFSIQKSAIVYLEVEWDQKIVKPYKTYFKGRYPFKQNATKEVPLSEFVRFFAPGGILDDFYKNNLKPFIENDLLSSSIESSELIRSDIIIQLEIANKIRDTFFDNGNIIGVQFSIEPVSMSSNKRRSVLNLDGQLIDYSHGIKKETKVVWPNSMSSDVESKLTFVNSTENSPRSLIFKGPWAQMRLLNAGIISNVENGSFDIRYDFDNGYVNYRVYTDESDNPFSRELFKRFQLPDTLY